MKKQKARLPPTQRLDNTKGKTDTTLSQFTVHHLTIHSVSNSKTTTPFIFLVNIAIIYSGSDMAKLSLQIKISLDNICQRQPTAPNYLVIAQQ